MHVNIIKNDDTGTTSVAAFIPGYGLLQAQTGHPNFDAILDGALLECDAETWNTQGLTDVDAYASLFDIPAAVQRTFKELSDRVSVVDGQVAFDGEIVDNALTDHLLRTMDEGSDVMPLVRFWENLAANPSKNSQQQFYRWLKTHDFAITSEGMVLGYKGVTDDLRSTRSGPAVVNGEPMFGFVPYDIGNVVSMPRADVVDDPEQTCSSGLHVGDYSFASTWSARTLLVEFNPRDVVSVPVDATDRKVRVSRLKVLEECFRPLDEAVSDTVYGVRPDGSLYHNKRGPDGRFVSSGGAQA